MYSLTLVLATILCGVYGGTFPTNQLEGRSGIVHLFEWKWSDIADECECFLGPKGFGGVQISPPTENLIIHIDGYRPWYERYQALSYVLDTRSGTEEEFLDMTTRCNNVGVRIYADAILNHMTAYQDEADNIGTAGNTVNFTAYSYPAVPYTVENFHYPGCSIETYTNATQVRNCELVGLKDLDQSEEYVREKLVEFMNHLIELGVAGFRIDAAKHMDPADLEVIFDRLDNLNTDFGFEEDARAYIYQEVPYSSGEAITPSEYYPLGAVTEFGYGNELTNVFRGNNDLRWLINWGEAWNLIPSDIALAFIDNHDTQRNNDILTFKEPRAYRGAVAFMLAHPYGEPQIMSSYNFTVSSEGPPYDANEAIVGRGISSDDQCTGGWICEHRWRQLYGMVGFRNVALDTEVENWWDNESNQIAFSRGDKAFIAFNLDSTHLNQTLQTGLPAGTYCDVISGELVDGACSGSSVTVNCDGTADIYLPYDGEDMMLAIHVDSCL